MVIPRTQSTPHSAKALASALSWPSEPQFPPHAFDEAEVYTPILKPRWCSQSARGLIPPGNLVLLATMAPWASRGARVLQVVS